MIILDGGMGTQLQAAGLPMGQAPELWNLTEPEKVTAVHRRYVEAGSKVLYTNTFGVNRLKTSRIGHSVRELVEGGVRCARAAAGEEDVRVALDIGRWDRFWNRWGPCVLKRLMIFSGRLWKPDGTPGQISL